MSERQFHVVVLREFYYYLFFFVKSDTHYKNPWSHAKLFFRETNVTLWSNYQLNYLPWQAEILAQRSNLTPQRANRIPWFACGTEVASLRSRRLEVVGERKNGRARGRHASGEGGSLSRARSFLRQALFEAPATQAIYFHAHAHFRLRSLFSTCCRRDTDGKKFQSVVIWMFLLFWRILIAKAIS